MTTTTKTTVVNTNTQRDDGALFEVIYKKKEENDRNEKEFKEQKTSLCAKEKQKNAQIHSLSLSLFLPAETARKRHYKRVCFFKPSGGTKNRICELNRESSEKRPFF